ncbi:hypothetical protein PUNSTDRAFT_120730 [Punctularia strigosozonata HHB-11173 SS5]|uniref:uncharacterized protein n=1 Tax=Punctularia strigosozonata (strain HHB-11173) TaxID=741275 RepID=UPI00044172F0|nr:uncharacterized protein PUNSTDRAFT_120730 [Punctularia strigosozonata HHB-11173 SS5]EIN08335.1 hypothetical protein PUNSTDRAFT_120730 [Punctularia strigosozonata HHB-11173 SS5]
MSNHQYSPYQRAPGPSESYNEEPWPPAGHDALPPSYSGGQSHPQAPQFPPSAVSGFMPPGYQGPASPVASFMTSMPAPMPAYPPQRAISSPNVYGGMPAPMPMPTAASNPRVHGPYHNGFQAMPSNNYPFVVPDGHFPHSSSRQDTSYGLPRPALVDNHCGFNPTPQSMPVPVPGADPYQSQVPMYPAQASTGHHGMQTLYLHAGYRSEYENATYENGASHNHSGFRRFFDKREDKFTPRGPPNKPVQGGTTLSGNNPVKGDSKPRPKRR